MIVSVSILAGIVLALYIGSKSLSGLQPCILLMTVAAGISMVVSPSYAEWLAHLMGVGRGSDLILYFGFILQMFLAANFYFRFKRSEAMIVQLVRNQALMSHLLETPDESNKG